MALRHALVVDDSRSARFAMRKYLERYRYEVTTAEDGSQALQYLQSNRPLVVFLDYLMPGVSGLDVLRQLKSDPATSAIPVVICSTVEKPEFQAQARSSGAVEVLPKPPGLEQLQKILEGLERAAERPAAAPAPAVATAIASVAVAAMPVPAGAPSTPVVPESAERFILLRGDIDSALKHLTDDIFVQIAELKAQLQHMSQAGMSGEDVNTLRQIAREEAESLNQAVVTELAKIRERLEAIDQLQRRERQEMLHAARVMAAQEAHAIAKHTVMDAASQLSHKLSDAIAKALGRAP